MKNVKQLFGTVSLINTTTEIIAILTDDGEYSITEMFDEVGLTLGDRVSGSLEELGEIILTNHTTRMSGKVWINDVGLDRQTAIQALKG